MRTYKLSIETSRLLRGLLLVFLIFFVFSISLPFLPIGESDNADNLVTIAITGAIVWGLASVYIFKIIRKLAYANVCVDDEGLWYANKPRAESLVKWEDIAEVIARPILERLDLLDSAENR